MCNKSFCGFSLAVIQGHSVLALTTMTQQSLISNINFDGVICYVTIVYATALQVIKTHPLMNLPIPYYTIMIKSKIIYTHVYYLIIGNSVSMHEKLYYSFPRLMMVLIRQHPPFLWTDCLDVKSVKLLKVWLAQSRNMSH